MKLLHLTALFLPILSACTSGQIAKAILDEEVSRLCKIDGGIRVYETVMLPPEKFNKRGSINFNIPKKEKAKDEDEYFFEWRIEILKKDTPSLSRSRYKIIRRNDDKTLGESIRYSRGGGDFPGPWQGSSFSCPDPTDPPSLEESIFFRGENDLLLTFRTS
jgi:hypothetical protein